MQSTEFLEELKSVNKPLNVFIPSLQKEVGIMPVTLNQQKNILDNLSPSASSVITFFNDTYKIIKSNLTESVDILVYDRPNILLTLRRKIDNNYNDIDISSILEKNKKLTAPASHKVVETEDFIFNLSVPTLSEDCKCNEYLLNTYKNETKLLGKIYVNEVAKFITSIEIKESGVEYSLTDCKPETKFEFISKIESSNFRDVYKFINCIRDFEKECVTINDHAVDIGPELFVL